MNLLTIEPGEILPFSLSGRFLICRRIEGVIAISQPDIGLGETRIKQADVITLDNTRSIFIHNKGDSSATIEVQSTAVSIASNDGGTVTIAGGSIDSIRDSIQVDAQATVENGTMTSQSPDTLNDVVDVVIPAGQRVQVVSADPTKARRVILLQNISATATRLRVGSAAVAANRGAVLENQADNIASFELECTGAVYVHNASGDPATVSVMHGSR